MRSPTTLTPLEAFLRQPNIEGSPAWEFVNGQAQQSLGHGTQLAWLIDLQRQQVWVWPGQDLPMIYAGPELLPTLGAMPSFAVETVMAMARQ